VIRSGVSVYMAAHNAEEWIERAILSCLQQTMSPLEVIVVDDASTDRTVEVVRGIVDPRVRLEVLVSNIGPGPARNVALELARGEWLAMMDADDEMAPTRLEVLHRATMEEPRQEIFTDIVSRHGSAGAPSSAGADAVPKPPFQLLTGADLLRRNLGAKPYFRAELLQRTGARYPDFRAAEDTSFLVQLATKACSPIVVVPARLYHYRDVPASLSKRSERMFTERLRALDHLESNFADDADLVRAIGIARQLFLDDRAMYRLKLAIRNRSPKAVFTALRSPTTWRVATRRSMTKLRDRRNEVRRGGGAI
jgi:succinoglycan biosynthesis protein ExoO